MFSFGSLARMKMRRAILAALRRDPELIPKMTGTLKGKIDHQDGRMATFVEAAEALEPVLADAVKKRPSKLGALGLKSAQLLASLAAEDDRSNKRLAKIAHGGTVGIVFVDVANFTTFTAQHGDHAASRILGRLNAIVMSAIRASNGERVKALGDGFLLAFPSASQAVRGAVALRHALGRERRRDPSFDVEVRIAVHAGEPLVEEDDLLGHDVNLTARLLDHCEPSEIVISETAKELAERRLRKIAFARRRVVKIRGLSTKVAVYSVNPGHITVSATRTRPETRSRGRAPSLS